MIKLLKLSEQFFLIIESLPTGHFFLDGPLDLIVVIGGACTMIAIANYTLDTTPTAIISSPKPQGDDDGKV